MDIYIPRLNYLAVIISVMLLLLLKLYPVSLCLCHLTFFSLYKKAGISKRKKPEVKYVVAKRGVGRFEIFF